MSKSNDLRNRVKSTSTAKQGAAEETADQPAAAAESAAKPSASESAAPVRIKPVRITADLSPQAYRRLSTRSAEVAAELGRAKVPLVDILRALVDRLDTDPDMRADVTADLRRQYRDTVQ